jgi:hypothetical protein
MVKVIHVDDTGAEMAVIELDDFTIETVYAGIATMLHEAAASRLHQPAPHEIPLAERLRRERILKRIHA